MIDRPSGRFADEWAKFSRRIPDEATDIQRSEMQHSFYAGAAMALGVLARGFGGWGELENELLAYFDNQKEIGRPPPSEPDPP